MTGPERVDVTLVDVWDTWRADVHERRTKRDRREAAKAARREAEAHLKALGTPALGDWQTSATVPADGPNRLDKAAGDVLAAACASAPRCTRCRCVTTPWEPANGSGRRYVCFGCGYDPDRAAP